MKDTLEIWIGEKAKRIEKNWFNEECRTVFQIRNAARTNLLRENAEVSGREYQEARKREKQI